MSPQAWVALWIGIAGIMGQIVTAFVVVQVAVRVIETRMEYMQGELDRLREWQKEVVDPQLSSHSSKIGRLQVQFDYFADDPRPD